MALLKNGSVPDKQRLRLKGKMGKLTPPERWRRLVMERFMALKQSGELKKFRKKGLAILGRKKLFTAEEWWRGFSKRASSKEYLEWYNECKNLGDRFGLAPWVVVFACLLKGYKPEEQPHVMEAEWPRIRVVTESTDPLFLAWLSHEAQGLGLYVVQQRGSVETTHVNVHYPVPPAALLPPSRRPPLHNAFHKRVETPVGYPPEAANQLQKEATRLVRELQRRLGYSVPQRLRVSPLVSQADKLQTGKGPLPYAGIYDIVEKIYPQDDLSEEQHRRRLIKSRRHRVRKRLSEPYETRALRHSNGAL